MATFYNSDGQIQLTQQPKLQAGGASMFQDQAYSGFQAGQGFGRTPNQNFYTSNAPMVTSGTQLVPQQQNPDPIGMSQSMAPQVQSVTSNGGQGLGQYQALLQALQQQGQTNLDQQQKAYKSLQSSILGPQGYLSGVESAGMNRINENQQNNLGHAEQDLTSRGLGNTTIRQGVMNGVNRNSEYERQNLQSQVGGQKASTAMQLFGMNPAPQTDTYLRLLTQLGSGLR